MTTPPPYLRQFSWPMRLFLTLLIAAISFRCFTVLFPIDDWEKEFEMRRYPIRLSTLAELADKSKHSSVDHPYPVIEDFTITAQSIGVFCKPWPDAKTRGKIRTFGDGVKVAACWVNGRLRFVEHLAGIDENWPMFSPGVRTDETYVRARLFYADDSERVVRLSIEPDDYTRYQHWGNKKMLLSQSYVDLDNEEECWGFCHMLTHRYGQNPAGAHLVKIVLFRVEVKYAPPGVDAQQHYENQNRLTANPPRLPGQYRSDPEHTADQVLPDFYEFDAADEKGNRLDQEK